VTVRVSFVAIWAASSGSYKNKIICLNIILAIDNHIDLLFYFGGQ
jgi:hypothetical protein